VIQHRGRGRIHIFVLIYKSAHERPLAFFRLESAFDKQSLQLVSVKSKNDAVDGDQ
jgi:hypothetical protein